MKHSWWVGVALVAGVAVIILIGRTSPHVGISSPSAGPEIGVLAPASRPFLVTSFAPNFDFVGPGTNTPTDAPTAYGFWSFAVPVPGVLSRSGQPLMNEFAWLKANGWKSVIDVRTDGEYGEVGDDAKLPGFTKLGLTYLYMPIKNGAAPSDAQAETFLSFVTNPANQPVHIHCRGGIGRSGTLTALYRYQVQKWPLDQTIAESRLFQGGVNDTQHAWLTHWAATHPHAS